VTRIKNLLFVTNVLPVYRSLQLQFSWTARKHDLRAACKMQERIATAQPLKHQYASQYRTVHRSLSCGPVDAVRIGNPINRAPLHRNDSGLRRRTYVGGDRHPTVTHPTVTRPSPDRCADVIAESGEVFGTIASGRWLDGAEDCTKKQRDRAICVSDGPHTTPSVKYC
jgi:hypothetical protein